MKQPELPRRHWEQEGNSHVTFYCDDAKDAKEVMLKLARVLMAENLGQVSHLQRFLNGCLDWLKSVPRELLRQSLLDQIEALSLDKDNKSPRLYARVNLKTLELPGILPPSSDVAIYARTPAGSGLGGKYRVWVRPSFDSDPEGIHLINELIFTSFDLPDNLRIRY